jgi:hypothetical protein
MKKIILFFVSILYCSALLSAQVWEINPKSDYRTYFEEAYRNWPNLPKGILESVAYTNTRIRHLSPSLEHESCMGLPHYIGVMGLIEDGKDYFNNNLMLIADLSEYPVEQIKNDPRINILAYAKAYSILMQQKNLSASGIEDHYAILDALTEIPNDGRSGNRFAFESQLYSIYKNLNSKAFQEAYSLPEYRLDLPKIFGEENYRMLSASKVSLSETDVKDDAGKSYAQGNIFRLMPPPCTDVSVGFPYPIIAAPADPSNYNSRSGVAITHVTIHTMQGSYAGSISWFQNPAANVSAHYNIRASDGQITQSVCEIDRAWHVSNSNSYAIGIEHEGFIADPTWYTDVMYRVSADLTKDIASRRAIQLKRTYDVNGDNGLNPLSDGCFKIKGHQHFPSQTHVDPGQFWDWNRYYDLLNPAASAPVTNFTACSGSFTDPGGAGNYANDERSFYLIAPTGASTVTLNFSSFNLEAGFDYLYVYDGDSYNDSLIAVLNGNSLPAPITGRSGKLFLELRSDCGTTTSGWVANWTCSTAASPCEEPVGLNETLISYNEVLLDWNDVTGATGYQVKFKQSLASAWQYYTVTASQLNVTGLARDGLYLWSVKTLCSGGNSSAWTGREFVNNIVNNTITTAQCSGTFTDMGGTLGNYRNGENYTFTIAPSGATSVTLTFSSFNTESGFDFLRIYDGPSTASPLIGTYSGTTLPPAFTSSGGALTIRFTSDNAQIRAGWVANWTCQSSLPVYPNPILLNTSMEGNLNCGLSFHDFFDSGNSTAAYGNNENNTMTFCHPDPNMAVRLSFRQNPTAAQQLSISSSAAGNDYLYIYNGPDVNSNLVGVYTGASSAAPQPGTFISSGNCVTVRMESDAATVGSGWIARLSCAAKPTVMPDVFVGGTEGTKTFTDLGGAANYGNNENYVITYRPHASAPAGEAVWADFGTSDVGIERNWDYLYVFDGPNTESRLICVYTGDSANLNHLGIIKATAANSSGALTFQFFSDGATTASGWTAQMRTGAARLAYGSEDCATATPINTVGATYAGTTMTATGRPGNPDPALNITLPIPECSGANTISRLENTVWYRFTTPDICDATSINVILDNISCQSEVPNGSGVQFVLYEADACQNGSGWGTSLYCADKLTSGNSVNIAPYLQANKSYYIMIDGFTGQHCNFDLRMEAVGATLPSSCLLPLGMLNFKGTPMSNHALINWETNFEADVQGFYLQRAKADGISFEDITYIEAEHNNTERISSYGYPDFDYLKNAVNYYRLRVLENDGTSYLHRIEAVDMTEKDTESNLLVYPNPAKNQLVFSLNSNTESSYSLRFFDITGKEVFSMHGNMNAGIWQEFFDISSLAAGHYVYQLLIDGKSQSGKFEKY